MYAEDRVLVGVIKRAQDLLCARERGWYRIPLRRWRDEEATYLALFLNGKLRAKMNADGGRAPRLLAKPADGRGAICYFAELRGYELATRRQLLPDERDHPRARELYCCLQLGPLRACQPPIINDGGHRFSFIRTSWGHFVNARRISQLFGETRLPLARSA